MEHVSVDINDGIAVVTLDWPPVNALTHAMFAAIAAVHGKVIGAGVALIANCDLVVASDDATFALTEINVGVFGGVRHAQRLVGHYLAKRMFLTGEFLSADELYRRGSLEAVVPAEELLEAALVIARPISEATARIPLGIAGRRSVGCGMTRPTTRRPLVPSAGRGSIRRGCSVGSATCRRRRYRCGR